MARAGRADRAIRRGDSPRRSALDRAQTTLKLADLAPRARARRRDRRSGTSQHVRERVRLERDDHRPSVRAPALRAASRTVDTTPRRRGTTPRSGRGPAPTPPWRRHQGIDPVPVAEGRPHRGIDLADRCSSGGSRSAVRRGSCRVHRAGSRLEPRRRGASSPSAQTISVADGSSDDPARRPIEATLAGPRGCRGSALIPPHVGEGSPRDATAPTLRSWW